MSRGGRLLRAPAAVPLGLGLLCLAVAFAQRPGRTFTDSRLEMSTDPQGFLGDAASVWSSTLDLGHVQGGLFAGYLLPQGPWYALADVAGLPTWIAQRLLLALVLALAAWGAVRLMDELWGSDRGLAHAVAGLLFALNPFVVVAFAVRGTVWLLAYAALPWVMLAVKRGLAEPRRWRYPAAAGLALGLSGGAINAASIFWVVVGALALAVYETAVSGRSRSDVLRFGARAAVCVAVGCIWWVLPLAVQGTYGADFQQFAEQPAIIWSTTSLSESLRLLGFWVMYLGSGFGGLDPELGIGAGYLFNAGLILASFSIPLLAFGGLRWTRGWRYAPFLGLLAVGALLVMAVGFPPGTPLRRGVSFTSDHVRALEVLRTTYKAAPLLALAMACLGGVAVHELSLRARSGRLRLRGRRLPRAALAAAVILPLLACLPLLSGRALDPEVAYDEVPSYWKQAVANAERVTPGDQRLMVMPGDLFAYYRWGFTTNSVAPTLTDRPVMVREVIRYSDPRAAQLQDATDDLVQQGRALPGQLPPLLELLGVGHVLLATDGVPRHSGALPAGALPASLAGQPGFDRPDATFGDTHRFRPPAGRSGRPSDLADISSYSPGGDTGIVRLHPRSGATVLDGDAQGVVSLSAHDALDPRTALVYGGDVDRSEVRRLVADGAELVFSDTGRRRVVSASRLRNSLGATLGPEDPISPDSPTYELFAGTDHETVARYEGLRYLRSTRLPYVSQFPEQRPYAALDGRLDTQWIQQGEADDSDCCLTLAPTRPLAAPAIEVLPVADRKGRTDRLSISENGGGERLVDLRPGWNTIDLQDRELRTLRLQVEHVSRPGGDQGEGGIVEMRVPGLRVAESLRLPTGLSAGSRGLDLSRTPVSVLLERTTADFPRRAGADVVAPQVGSPLDMVDAEQGLERDVTLPEGRELAIDGWASAAPGGNDALLDRLAGVPGGWRMEGSSRFEGVPSRRASSAFDRDPGTSWVADRVPGRTPWLSVRAPRPFAARAIEFTPGPAGYRVPSRVRVRGDGRDERLEPDRSGVVRLSRPLRTRSLRIDVLQTRPGSGRPRTGALRGVALAEVRVPGLRPPPPRRRGALTTACGELEVRGVNGVATARVSGTVQGLDSGGALRMAGCGPRARLALPAGESHLSAPPGPAFRPDRLRLRSRRGAPLALGPGRVVDPGSGRDGHRNGVRLALSAPGWLVLGESYSPGWRAWCRDGSGSERDLGESEPMDGFANGWPVEPGCTEARFAFTPQRAATAGYGLSALGALLLGVLLLVGARRRRRAAPRAVGLDAHRMREPIERGSRERIRAGWRVALGAGLAAALVGGFVFALRAGVVIGPVVVLALRVGVTSRGMLRVATVALALIPVLYVVFPADDRGGYAFEYAIENLAAHWLAVVVVCCLAVVSLLELRSVAGRPGERQDPVG